MRLLLVRHGQTPANVRGALETARPGPRLTRLGVRQSKAIPGALAHEQIDAIYVSPLIRTSLTAAPLARVRALEPVVLEGLQEIEAGELEGKTDKESVHAYMGVIFAWSAGELDRSVPGGPTGRQFFARFDAALKRIATLHPDPTPDPASEDAPTIVVVSHGAAIRMWTSLRGRNVPDDFVKTHMLDNTGVVALTGSPSDGWLVETWAGEPIGGKLLSDPTASDPTGDAKA